MRIIALGDRDPGYLTHREIDATLSLLAPSTEAVWVASDSPHARNLGEVDGVWLLPGSPYRDDDAAYGAVRHCLDGGTPFLGTCGGFQYACIELARRYARVSNPAHAESDSEADEPVVVPLSCSLYGEVRRVTPVQGTKLAAICGSEPFDGYHFCGYGLDDAYARLLEQSGVVLAASAADAGTEAVELTDHPFFIATAFQPQVGSSQTQRLHPLIAAFASAAEGHQRKNTAGVSPTGDERPGGLDVASR